MNSGKIRLNFFIDKFNCFCYILGMVKSDPLPRFEAKYIPEPNSGCWLWIGAIHDHRSPQLPYGSFRFFGKPSYAHRVAWHLYRGEIPSGAHVLHKCDQPMCVNPQHLRLGDHLQNMKEMTDKKRYKVFLGERHANSKLKESQVLEIRRSELSLAELARDYGVTVQAVFAVKHRQTWKHI